jgi:CheY-like chemotaxis protein
MPSRRWALHRAKVHLIVSDLSMPGIDGLELLLRVRTLPGQRQAPTPAIALTALDTAAYRRRALDAGFDGYLSKPFDSEALVRAIVRLCR